MPDYYISEERMAELLKNRSELEETLELIRKEKGAQWRIERIQTNIDKYNFTIVFVAYCTKERIKNE
jgi:hypothetical protein